MTQYDIANELMQDDNANWSRAGAFALAEYLEELEASIGETIEFLTIREFARLGA